MFLSAPIPPFRLSHCLQVRISNFKPAHASDYIYNHGAYFSLYTYIRKENKPIFLTYTLLYIKGFVGRRKI